VINMSLKLKILALALLPLLLVTATVTWINAKQAHELAHLEITTFEHTLLLSKRQELKNYVDMGMAAIAPILKDRSLTEEEAQFRVKRILHSLTFGDDGYFFVYDLDGVNLVHPALPELVGQPLWALQDDKGEFVIQSLLSIAKSGGGYHRYRWSKPSIGGQEDKLGYVVEMPKWGWMIGTGLYLDDITAEVARVREEVTQNVRDTFFAVVVITGLTALIIVIIGIAINLHESRLADSRLRDLAHKSVRFQVNQRRRFARELHDGINQLMVSVKFRIELAINKLKKEDATAVDDLTTGMQVLNLAIKEVRRVSHDLRPSVLDDLGLEAALKSLLNEYEERTGIIVETILHLPKERLPDDIEITLYRVIQEALSNVEKHAEADEVRLTTRFDRRNIYLTLRDNGCGFVPEQHSGAQGIGVRNMHDRIELLSGEFELTSDLNKGTRIRVSLPLA
jgi:two-component system NarL family sensor kinase